MTIKDFPNINRQLIKTASLAPRKKLLSLVQAAETDPTLYQELEKTAFNLGDWWQTFRAKHPLIDFMRLPAAIAGMIPVPPVAAAGRLYNLATGAGDVAGAVSQGKPVQALASAAMTGAGLGPIGTAGKPLSTIGGKVLDTYNKVTTPLHPIANFVGTSNPLAVQVAQPLVQPLAEAGDLLLDKATKKKRNTQLTSTPSAVPGDYDIPYTGKAAQCLQLLKSATFRKGTSSMNRKHKLNKSLSVFKQLSKNCLSHKMS